MMRSTKRLLAIAVAGCALGAVAPAAQAEQAAPYRIFDVAYATGSAGPGAVVVIEAETVFTGQNGVQEVVCSAQAPGAIHINIQCGPQASGALGGVWADAFVAAGGTAYCVSADALFPNPNRHAYASDCFNFGN
jgi:hypothetical protein